MSYFVIFVHVYICWIEFIEHKTDNVLFIF